MPADRLEGVALVTGGGRGIGASIARELAEAGMRVAVTGRTPEQVDAVAAEIGGLALVGDVSQARRRRALGRDDRARARSDRPARVQRRDRRQRQAFLDEAARRVVARVRGERPRRVSLLPHRRADDGRARTRDASSTSGAAARTFRSRTRDRPARPTARARPRSDGSPRRSRLPRHARHPRVPHQPGPRANGR